MAWENFKREPKEPSYAYVDKPTKAEGEQNPYVKEAAEKLLEVAKQIGQGLADSGLSTTSKTREGKEYTDQLVVKVEPATRWNKETRDQETVLHNDGTPVYAPKIEMKHGNETLTLFAKENVSEGVQLTAQSVQKWAKDYQTGVMKPSYIKGDEIAESKVSSAMKAVAAYVADNGYIQAREQSPLKQFAYESNQHFNAYSEKVPNKDGNLVNDAYAQYQSGEYGEKVQLRSHSDPQIVVELGITQDGQDFAKAINFDMKDENGRPATAFINKPEDIAEYISVPEIQDAVAQFKGFVGDDKDQAKDKPKSKPMERE